MPLRTNDYVGCPRTSNALWLPQTKGMVRLAGLKLSELCSLPVDLAHDIKYEVLHDPCRAQTGKYL